MPRPQPEIINIIGRWNRKIVVDFCPIGGLPCQLPRWSSGSGIFYWLPEAQRFDSRPAAAPFTINPKGVTNVPNYKITIKVTNNLDTSQTMSVNRTINGQSMHLVYRPFYDLLQEADEAVYPLIHQLDPHAAAHDAKS